MLYLASKSKTHFSLYSFERIEFENKKIRLEEKYVRRRDSANRIFEERLQYNTKIRDSLEEVLNGKK